MTSEQEAEIRNASICISSILRQVAHGQITEVSAFFEIQKQNVRIWKGLNGQPPGVQSKVTHPAK